MVLKERLKLRRDQVIDLLVILSIMGLTAVGVIPIWDYQRNDTETLSMREWKCFKMEKCNRCLADRSECVEWRRVAD
jgi:hypothetical protein